ncbi:hypothetical protein [Pararhizobium sp. LjRoot238]|uniref:hypothetical protein n=1 Tax=Pararhizobium sp. LjRoot238 TaxID=3342293 RepID=UPI003ECD4E59
MVSRLKLLKDHDYLARLEAGELDTEQKQKKLLDAYAEELSVKRLAWQNLQASLVAGARNQRFLRLAEVAIPRLAAA